MKVMAGQRGRFNTSYLQHPVPLRVDRLNKTSQINMHHPAASHAPLCAAFSAPQGCGSEATLTHSERNWTRWGGFLFYFSTNYNKTKPNNNKKKEPAPASLFDDHSEDWLHVRQPRRLKGKAKPRFSVHPGSC